MTKINCFYISHCSEIMKKNIIAVSKVKTKLLIDIQLQLYLTTSQTTSLGQTRLKYKLKNPEIPFFQHLIMKK